MESLSLREVKIDEDLLQPFHIEGEFLEELQAKFEQARAELRHVSETEQKLVNQVKSKNKELKDNLQKVSTLISTCESERKRASALQTDIANTKRRVAELVAQLRAQRALVKAAQKDNEALEQKMTSTEQSEVVIEERRAIAALEATEQQQRELLRRETNELKRARETNEELAEELKSVEAAYQRSQEDLNSLKLRIKTTQEQINAHQVDEMETKQRIDELKQKYEQTEATSQMQTAKLKALKEQLQSTARQIREQQIAIDAKRTEAAKAKREVLQTDKSLGSLAMLEAKLQQELQNREAEVEELQKRLQRAKALAEREEAQSLELYHKAYKKEEERNAAELERRRLVSEVAALRELIEGREGKRNKLRQLEKEKDDYIRAREVLSEGYSSTVDQVRMNEAALKVGQAALANAQNELQACLASIRTLAKVIESLRRSRAALEEENLKKRTLRAKVVEEIADRKLKAAQLQELLRSAENALYKNQSLGEKALTERNYFQKRLVEKRSEARKARADVMQLHMGNQRLRQELQRNRKALEELTNKSAAVRADIIQIEDTNLRVDRRITYKKRNVSAQAERLQDLSAIVADADAEMRQQLKQYNAVVSEHGVLARYLVKRNEEVAHMYEYLRLQKSLLDKSRRFYDKKLKALREYEATRDALTKALTEVTADSEKFEALTKTINAMQQELVEERLRMRALAEALRKPLNIHRWRRIKDTNAEAYATLKKIRALQRALVQKSTEVQDKDKAIEEKEKLYVSLRKVLARQPGSEAHEQLRLYAATLAEKQEKYRVMKNELKLFQNKVFEYKADIERLQHELKLVKLDYFVRRRRQQQLQGDMMQSDAISYDYSAGNVDEQLEETLPTNGYNNASDDGVAE